MKRQSIIIAVIFFAVSSFAHAAPLNATKIGGMWTTTPITTAATQAVTGFRGAFTPMNIGMSIGTYVIISTIGDGINQLRAEMGTNLPVSALPSVPGWTTPQTPPASMGTVIFYSSSTSNNGNVNVTLSTQQAVCTANNVNTITYVWNGAARCNEYDNGVSTGGYFGLTSVTTCTSGYEYNGNVCSLVNSQAAQWPSDGIQTIKLNPVTNKFQYEPRDPDNDGQMGEYAPFERIGTDMTQNPVKETLTPNVVGGVDYQRDTESVNQMTGEPAVQRDKFSTDSVGKVLSTTSTIYNNSTISNVSTTKDTPIDTSTLAKDLTLVATNSKLDAISTKLETSTAPMPTNAAVRTLQQSTDLVVNKLKSKLPTATYSDTVPDCPVFSQDIPFINTTLIVDQFCTMDELIRPTLSTLSLVLYAVLGFLIVVRA